jgi:hypothetical protein
MIDRPKTHLLFPLLALGLTLAIATSAYAQYQGSSSTSATLRVSFGTAPHWAVISGTRVEGIPQAERPDYDMFRYDGNYYAYNNNRWYTSRADRGEFTAIDDRSVPSELSRVPRDHWRNYPSGWAGGSSATLRVSFGTTPRWASISGTRVQEIRRADRPDYDMFRYDGNYYAYNNDRWYTSRADRGEFTAIDDRSVPGELSRVPRGHWRNYPSGWANGGSASMQINFGTSPRWSNVRGTRVGMLRQNQRPGYDVFRYGRNYYVYNDNQWYRSNSPRGRYMWLDERSVPAEVLRVPREHWRNYPSGQSSDRNSNPRYSGYNQGH